MKTILDLERVWDAYLTGSNTNFEEMLSSHFNDLRESGNKYQNNNIVSYNRSIIESGISEIEKAILNDYVFIQHLSVPILQIWKEHKGVMVAYAICLMMNGKDNISELSLDEFKRILFYINGWNYMTAKVIDSESDIINNIIDLFQEIIKSDMSMLANICSTYLCGIQNVADRYLLPMLIIPDNAEMSRLIKNVNEQYDLFIRSNQDELNEEEIGILDSISNFFVDIYKYMFEE
jgi:hypothetical protein